jgi:cytochrome c nitrite reductase small subunit
MGYLSKKVSSDEAWALIVFKLKWGVSVRKMRKAFATILGLAIGAPLGLGIYVFYIAKGYSYLSNDPRACINCHVMTDQYRSWSASSHHAFTSCNSCHVPEGIVSKYLTKAEHGFRHSWAFTSGVFVDPIRMKPSSERVVEANCRTCHQAHIEVPGRFRDRGAPESCIRCHSGVGHKR